MDKDVIQGNYKIEQRAVVQLWTQKSKSGTIVD